MARIKYPIYTLLFLLLTTACQSQTRKNNTNEILGGPCEGCEAIFEYGDKKLAYLDTLPLFSESEPKIKITGTVFKIDQKTPAENVIIYIYHTDRDGIYKKLGDEKGWGKRHGSIRGWAKTDANGKYTFFTFRPAAYPNGQEPEHIHMTIKEPDKKEYYIDDILFMDDPKLTSSEKESLKNRAGNGVVQLEKEGDILIANRDIILGLNIPNYN